MTKEEFIKLLKENISIAETLERNNDILRNEINKYMKISCTEFIDELYHDLENILWDTNMSLYQLTGDMKNVLYFDKKNTKND